MARTLGQFCVFSALLLLASPGNPWASQENAVDHGPAANAVSAPQVARAPQYRQFFYNYPHEIPADYVYRTERVFSPQAMNGGSILGLPGSSPPPTAAVVQETPLAEAVRTLAVKLIANAREEIAEEYGVAVSTFVNLNNLYATSALGRYVSEQLISELQQAGLEVVDVRKTPGIMISREHGEYGLSRDMSELSYIQAVQAMVVGTYAVADGRVFLNARLLRNEDNLVLSAASLELPLDQRVAGMLADEAMPVGKGAPVAVRAFHKQ